MIFDKIPTETQTTSTLSKCYFPKTFLTARFRKRGPKNDYVVKYFVGHLPNLMHIREKNKVQIRSFQKCLALAVMDF